MFLLPLAILATITLLLSHAIDLIGRVEHWLTTRGRESGRERVRAIMGVSVRPVCVKVRD